MSFVFRFAMPVPSPDGDPWWRDAMEVIAPGSRPTPLSGTARARGPAARIARDVR